MGENALWWGWGYIFLSQSRIEILLAGLPPNGGDNLSLIPHNHTKWCCSSSSILFTKLLEQRERGNYNTFLPTTSRTFIFILIQNQFPLLPMFLTQRWIISSKHLTLHWVTTWSVYLFRLPARQSTVTNWFPFVSVHCSSGRKIPDIEMTRVNRISGPDWLMVQSVLWDPESGNEKSMMEPQWAAQS